VSNVVILSPQGDEVAAEALLFPFCILVAIFVSDIWHSNIVGYINKFRYLYSVDFIAKQVSLP